MYVRDVRPNTGPGWNIATQRYSYWLWSPRPASEGKYERTQWKATWTTATDGGTGHGDTPDEAFLDANWPANFAGARRARRELTEAAEAAEQAAQVRREAGIE